MNIPKKTYNHSRKIYDIKQILSDFKDGKIDTQLDCQRGLVWTQERKQDLIDTLINREIIPEFHVIKEEWESISHFADGKQRISTILDFLNDKLYWYKSSADERFYDLFGKARCLKFSELPTEWQNMIYNYELQFAVYNNMDEKSTTKLFRKLNAGVPLSEFAKTLAENITLKTHFLNDINNHPVLPRIFSQNRLEKDDSDQSFVQLFLLMRRYDSLETDKSLDLRPSNLKTYFTDVVNASPEEAEKWKNDLLKYRDIILNLLDRLNNFDIDLRTNNNPPIIMLLYYAYVFNLSDEVLMQRYRDIVNLRTKDVIGNGADFNTSHVRVWMATVKKILI